MYTHTYIHIHTHTHTHTHTHKICGSTIVKYIPSSFLLLSLKHWLFGDLYLMYVNLEGERWNWSCWPFTDSYWTTIAGLTCTRAFSDFLWPSRGPWVRLDGMLKQWDSGLLNQFLEDEESFGRSFEIKHWVFT